MREVIVLCRSRKKARDEVARVLDQYFWRVGDRAWRGRASNACLDRVSRDLRRRASRATAVVIHEIRSAHESRRPIIRIGSKAAFSEGGLAPVASHPAATARIALPQAQASALAVLRIAALFHDLGKVTRLFQSKLDRAAGSKKPEADAVRHDLFSAMVWDELCGELDDQALIARLSAPAPGSIDEACRRAAERLLRLHATEGLPLDLAFATREDTLAQRIGLLILTHHRLPEANTPMTQLLPEVHLNRTAALLRADLAPAPGCPFWHDEWWCGQLARDASRLVAGIACPSLDIGLRTALMLADHLGSAKKVLSPARPEHLANLIEGAPADSLALHIRRVWAHCRVAFDTLLQARDRFPALPEDRVPRDIAWPLRSSDPRFAWQAGAAAAARSLAGRGEGGFFACLLAGTGTGKTRAAPTVLAAAAFADARPERRYLRFSLGLGLRVLATQSAREYVDDLGFSAQDMSVVVGQEPIFFGTGDRAAAEEGEAAGSESLIDLPDWLRVEMAEGPVPGEGAEKEADWLRGLSLDTGRALPAFCEEVIRASGTKAADARRLVAPPIMVGTVDHLMPVASPERARHRIAALRVVTSDLILDEIDQYDAESLAALARLVYQAGAAGRRVVILSATLTADIAGAFHSAYRAGWRVHADAAGMAGHVHLLCCADAPGAVADNADGAAFGTVFDRCRDAVLSHLSRAAPQRRGEILPVAADWAALVAQVHAAVSRMHDLHGSLIGDCRVSFGLVRMTTISQTETMIRQLPAGAAEGRLRLIIGLHSGFLRLQREWIEHRLRRALTRKGADPDAGLRHLCQDEGLFARAQAAGCRDIEIVAVTSPVIETGNDLDFDYAVVDPSSLRAIVQTAGRVRRHRRTTGHGPNIVLFGRSPIVMKHRKLAWPGVETALASETQVSTPDLCDHVGSDSRDLSCLLGSADVSAISATLVLDPQPDVPLRAAEAALRAAMLKLEGGQAPLGRYLTHLMARVSRRSARIRRFRRATGGEFRLFLRGEGPETAECWGEIALGGHMVPARRLEPEECLRVDGRADIALFPEALLRAWRLVAPAGDGQARAALERLASVSFEMHAGELADTTFPAVRWSDLAGIVRAGRDDLSEVP